MISLHLVYGFIYTLLVILMSICWYNRFIIREPKKKKSQTSVIKETIVERYNEVEKLANEKREEIRLLKELEDDFSA